MALKWSTYLQNAALEGVRTALANGIIEIYSGAQPVGADSAVQGTLLGRVTVNAGAFTPGTATNGIEFSAAADRALVKAPAEVWQFVGLATGQAGWFRHKGNGVDAGSAEGGTPAYPRMDGRIGVSGSGAEMILSSLSITTGATTTIDSYSLSMPAGLY